MRATTALRWRRHFATAAVSPASTICCRRKRWRSCSASASNSTVWRRSYRQGYLGAYPELGFVSPLLLQLAAELKAAMPELLGDHHLTYWWSFVCQHQRPGTDIHADQSDISLNFWITPDSANLAPGGGGLEMWNMAAPSDWTFNDYNADGYRIRLHLSQMGAQRKSFPYAENRGLLFNGMLFHQTAGCRFADGFENRRRNITMLFRRNRAAPTAKPALHPGTPTARRFFFLVDRQISNAAASDSLGNLALERQRSRIWRSQRAHHGQWPAIRGPQTAAFLPGHCP